MDRTGRGSRSASHTGDRNVSYTNSRNASHKGSRGANARGNDRFYVYGNTAQTLELQRQLEEAPAKKPSVEVQKNREKAHHMNAGYVLFLGAALVASAYILVNYLQLQAEASIWRRSRGWQWENWAWYMRMKNRSLYMRASHMTICAR